VGSISPAMISCKVKLLSRTVCTALSRAASQSCGCKYLRWGQPGRTPLGSGGSPLASSQLGTPRGHSLTTWLFRVNAVRFTHCGLHRRSPPFFSQHSIAFCLHKTELCLTAQLRQKLVKDLTSGDMGASATGCWECAIIASQSDGVSSVSYRAPISRKNSCCTLDMFTEQRTQ